MERKDPSGISVPDAAGRYKGRVRDRKLKTGHVAPFELVVAIERHIARITVATPDCLVPLGIGSQTSRKAFYTVDDCQVIEVFNSEDIEPASATVPELWRQRIATSLAWTNATGTIHA